MCKYLISLSLSLFKLETSQQKKKTQLVVMTNLSSFSDELAPSRHVSSNNTIGNWCLLHHTECHVVWYEYSSEVAQLPTRHPRERSRLVKK